MTQDRNRRPRALDPGSLERNPRDAVQDEVQFYLDMRTEELIAGGMAPEAARLEAEAAFGDRAQLEAQTALYAGRTRRRRRREVEVEAFAQDLRQAVRALARRPGYVSTAALTLALGIGGTTAMFAVVNGVLLRPLPYPEPGELVQVWEADPRRGLHDSAPANYLDARAGTPSFENLTAYLTTSRNLVGQGEPERLSIATTSANFFETLEVSPLVGRTFDGERAIPGEARNVVLSHAFWNRRFGADREVLGRTLRLDDESVTVVGVMPDGFDYPEGVALWIKAPLDVPETGPVFAGQDHTAQRSSWYFNVLGRLAGGSTLERAQSELDAVAAHIRDVDPKYNADTEYHAVLLHDQTVQDARGTLWMLFGAVGFVLLIACVNVANLVLVRSSDRTHELAVRTALGAGRLRLVGHLWTESAVLGALGGALGLAFGLGALQLLRAAPGLPRAAEIAAEPGVIAFAVALTALAALAFGLLPALGTSTHHPRAALGSRADGASGERGATLRRTLVVAEVGLAVVLVIGAGLTLQSLWRMSAVDLGIQTDELVVMRFSLPGARNQDKSEWQATYATIAEQIGRIPGVEAVGLSSSDPITPGWRAGLRVEGRPVDTNNPLDAGWSTVTAGYFGALGLDIVAGRGFEPQDGQGAVPVAVINQTMAERVFPGADPLGERINTGLDGPGRYVTVVGVIEDVRNRGPVLPVQAAYFRPLAQESAFGGDRVALVVQGAGDLIALVSAAQSAVWDLEPDAPFYGIEPGSELGTAFGTELRFVLAVLGAFAGLALVLGAVGVYGVTAGAARRRTREIGIRIALGAERRQAAGLILREGVGLAVLGTVLGAVAALGLMRLLSGMLFGVTPVDPPTYLAVAVALIAVALVASWIPARRAGAVDPLVAMRLE